MKGNTYMIANFVREHCMGVFFIQYLAASDSAYVYGLLLIQYYLIIHGCNKLMN